MRKVELRMNEEYKYKIIKKLVETNGNKQRAAIDDATGQVVGLYFDKQETLNDYYNITHQILSKYGIPYLIKTDKRTVFEYKKKASSKVEEDTFTQYAYACKQ